MEKDLDQIINEYNAGEEGSAKKLYKKWILQRCHELLSDQVQQEMIDKQFDLER